MARVAKYTALSFVLTGNADHKARAIAALLRAFDGPIYTCDPTISSSPVDETYRGTWAQNFAAAYDWMQPYLSSQDNLKIRARLATEAQALHDNLRIWAPRPHNHLSKPAWALGTLALTLSSHPSAASWLQTALEAANENTIYFLSQDGIYREGSQYYIYSYINLVPFLYHYKNVSGVDYFSAFKPVFLWEFHVSNNAGWMPNVEDSYLRHNFLSMVARQFLSTEDRSLHPTAKLGELFQWRHLNTDKSPWGGEFGNNTGASDDDTMDIDKFLSYDPTIRPIAPVGSATKFFPGGQSVFRNHWGYRDPSSRYLLFHGVAEADNHNHFDHLSFLIHAENQLMASDSGYTRLSYGESIRRSWYRTHSAHNTVALDGTWPVDQRENFAPVSRYSIDTNFFDFQEKEARYISQTNNSSNGENDLIFPSDAQTLGTLRRAIAFPGQEYFVVADQLTSKNALSHKYELYLHGGRGKMSGTGNQRLWTYTPDVYGGAAQFAAWIFSEGASFTDATGEVTYVKGDYASFGYVKGTKTSPNANFIQVLIPLGSPASLPVVSELSDSARVGGTVEKGGNLDTFLVKQGDSLAQVGSLATDGSFGYSRFGGALKQYAVREATLARYDDKELFHSSAKVTLAMDTSDSGHLRGRILSSTVPYSLSLRCPAGKQALGASAGGVSIPVSNDAGYAVLASLPADADLDVSFTAGPISILPDPLPPSPPPSQPPSPPPSQPPTQPPVPNIDPPPPGSKTGGSYLIDGNAGTSFIEAEAYSKMTGNWAVTADSRASGGSYISTANGSGNTSSTSLAYNVNVVNGGTFYIYLLSTGPDGSSDSFYLAVDSGSKSTVVTGSDGVWLWKRGSSVSMPAGNHTIYIRVREDGAIVDKLSIGRTSQVPTGQGAPALEPVF
jgi:hypothetical protein